MPRSDPLPDRRPALVAGASSGIGEATAIKLAATPLGVRKIDIGEQGGRIVFAAQPNIDVAKLLALIGKQPKVYKLDGQDKLRIVRPLADATQRADEIDALLGTIAA